MAIPERWTQTPIKNVQLSYVLSNTNNTNVDMIFSYSRCRTLDHNWYEMLIISDTLYLLSIYLLLDPTYCFARKAMFKRKLCVQFQIENYTSDAPRIASIDKSTKWQCMGSCVRQPSCSAFHFRSADASCELLTTLSCMKQNVTNGTTYVRLTACSGKQPWGMTTPTQGKLKWLQPGEISSRKVFQITNSRQVARVLYEGTYLPGYFLNKKDEFQSSDFNGKTIKCTTGIEIMTYSNEIEWAWVAFTPGETVPSSAVVGGFWQDGSPLYIVNIKLTEWKSGFYSAITGQYYTKFGGSDEASDLLMLIEN